MAVFNVKDFGAAGNGIEDDFPAFQRALDALDSLIPPTERVLIGGGGVLFIPAGLYNLTQTLFVKNGTIVQGCGSESTRLRFVSPVTANTTIAGVVLDHGGTSIRDLGIVTGKSYDPNGGNPLVPPEISEDERTFPDGIGHMGIRLYGSSSVENCFVNGFEHDGIHIHDPSGKHNTDRWQVSGCLVQECGRHGLFVAGSTSGGVLMRVECASNRKYGFYDMALGG